MSADGQRVLDEGKIIVQDPENLPTLEGPKLYKRNGYYYIVAPFGGVGTGAQAVLRARNIYGPYEHRVVLAEGSTRINGPHQGGYVETPDGQGWFIHFQAREAHGRIVHLEPVYWQSGWPVIGEAPRGAITGEPVASGSMPDHVGDDPPVRPQTSDDFNEPKLNPQWEWNHNPDDAHWSLTVRSGYLRLMPMYAEDLLTARNTLTQTMQDDSFQLTVRLDVRGMKAGAHTGLTMFEKSASGLEIAQTGNQRRLSYFHLPESTSGPVIFGDVLQLRVRVRGDSASYFYSLDDGRSFEPIGVATPIRTSWWKGPRPSLFAYTTAATDPGAVDFDWVRYQALGTNPW
jgi:beta-xylosidase